VRSLTTSGSGTASVMKNNLYRIVQLDAKLAGSTAIDHRDFNETFAICHCHQVANLAVTIGRYDTFDGLTSNLERGFSEVRNLGNTQVGGTVAKNINHDDVRLVSLRGFLGFG